MKFQPKTEKDLAEANLWPNGNYAFEILEAEETVSNSGNDMFKLKNKIFNENGKSQNVFDYIVPGVSDYKLRHLADVCGLLAEYESGELDAYQLVGKSGMCKVGVSKDKSGQYPDKNSIADYLVDKKAPTLKEAIGNDVVPF